MGELGGYWLEPRINLHIAVKAQRKNESNQYAEVVNMTLESLRDLLSADPDAIKTIVTGMINRSLEPYGEEVKL